MNIMNFDYTKANGVTSSRVLSPVIVPNTMYEGFDITELDSEQQGDYIAQIEAAKSDFAAECARIQAAFDVKTMYRRFDPTKMTNVVKENI